MAGNPSFGNLLSTTTAKYADVLRDNYTAQSGLLDFLKKSGNIKTEDGGVVVLEYIEFASNGAYNRYRGSQAWDLENLQFATAASFQRKYISVPVVITGAEQITNAGSSRKIDLIKSKVANAGKTLSNGMAADVYSDGTDDLQIGGLRYLISDTPAVGNVGGIDASDADNAFWQNTAISAALTTANMVSTFESMILATTRNNDRPNAIFADNEIYLTYYNALQAQQRFVEVKGQGGFRVIAHDELPIICDQNMSNGMGGSIPESHAYFFNSDYLYLRPNIERNVVTREKVTSINQDLSVTALLWAGNLTTSGRAFNGVLIAQ